MPLIIKKNIIPISLILILIFSRLIPHPPNFTPIISSAILGVYFFKDLKTSIFVVFMSLLFSDLILGVHINMVSVYLSIFFIILIYSYYKIILSYKNLLIHGFLASLIFYLITNFSVWMMSGMYEKNLTGLIQSYYFAIPFFKNTLLSTLFFSYIFLFFYKTLEKTLKYNFK